jgi:SCP-2 sterol transfer family
MSMPHPFLSDEWLEEARRIRAEYEGQSVPFPHPVRMNLVVTGAPFGDKDIDAHMDTSSGELVLDVGHLETPDLKVTVDYDTAKAILIDGNPAAGMQAFMAGKIKVDGDVGKLLALQSAPVGAESAAAEMANRLKEITS